MTAGRAGCAAPGAALFLRPDGGVRPCCWSNWELGRIGPGGPSLAEIWDGEPRRRLVEAVSAGDFGLGCQSCDPAMVPDRAASPAATFDHLGATTGGADVPRHVDLSLSNACNLQCVMCNGGLSSAIRAHRDHLPPLPKAYDAAFFEEFRRIVPHLDSVHFKGGEPFLSPEVWQVCELLLESRRSRRVVVTTNATVWNPRVERYVRDLEMHVVVSVDGMDAATLQRIRPGLRWESFWQNVAALQSVTDATGAGMTWSWCLMPENRHQLVAFLRACDERGVAPNVVLVDQPSSHDLRRTEPVELTRIIDAMDRSGRETGAALSDAGREVLDDVLEDLRRAASTPVEVRRPGAAAVDPERRRLERAAGVGVLTFHVERGVVQRVDAPPWSAPFRPEQWVPCVRDELMTRAAAAIGGRVEAIDIERSDGWIRARLRLESPALGDRELSVAIGESIGPGVDDGIILMVPVVTAEPQGGPPAVGSPGAITERSSPEEGSRKV